MLPSPTFTVTSIDCFERPIRLRLPFRFGSATLTEAIQAFVRARILLPDGREGVGEGGDEGGAVAGVFRVGDDVDAFLPGQQLPGGVG